MSPPTSPAVGRSIRHLRMRAGRTLSTIARQCGLSTGELEAIERGSTRPSIGQLSDIAGALDTTLRDLVLAKPDPKRDVRKSLARIAQCITDLPDDVGSKLDAVEAAVVRHAMLTCGGNQSAAARLLGVERKALVRRWQRIERESRPRRAASGRAKRKRR